MIKVLVKTTDRIVDRSPGFVIIQRDLGDGTLIASDILSDAMEAVFELVEATGEYAADVLEGMTHTAVSPDRHEVRLPNVEIVFHRELLEMK